MKYTVTCLSIAVKNFTCCSFHIQILKIYSSQGNVENIETNMNTSIAVNMFQCHDIYRTQFRAITYSITLYLMYYT